jgi:phosphoglycerate dehydrogenase-like enzyme
MRSVVTVHSGFEASWPWTADHLHALWRAQGPVEFLRSGPGDNRPLGKLVDQPATVTRLVALGTPVGSDCVKAFSSLTEVALCDAHGPSDAGKRFADRGVTVHAHDNEGYWGQSVAEYALALTLCGLRRIPQNHHAIISDLKPWDYAPVDGIGRPGTRGYQFGDDARFANGTVQGKRVRVVGAGNVASRYAAFTHALGAEVAAWDPYASEPCFHRAGARREHHLERLVSDAEIFAPIVPLTPQTEGLITTRLIDALPRGCLVVLTTRADICDMKALRRRVLADELALAADVFDLEPLPLKDPLLGRHNVVHTPHSAGRTRQANEEFATRLAERFR